jgi:hypothetical protein
VLEVSVLPLYMICYGSLGSCVLYITKNTDSKFYIGIYETKSALDKQKLIIQKTLVESKYL